MDHALSQLSARQHGVIARRQLLEVGFDSRRLRTALASGWMELATPRVVRVTSAPRTLAQELTTAILHVGNGALLSHASALAWWGVPGFTMEPITIAVPRWRRIEDCGWQVRHATVIPDEHRSFHLGVESASPALALFQVAGDISLERTAIAVDRTWSMRLTSGDQLNALLERLGRRGRDGIANMRLVMAERGPGYRPPQSGLEQRVLKILSGGGLDVRIQVDLGEEEWTGRVDFVVNYRVVVEVHSERYHTSLTDRTRDAWRHRRLESAGWVVVEAWDSDVFSRPWIVLAATRAALYDSVVSNSVVQPGPTRRDPQIAR
jgi:very-short-patch-repair endonuclease